MLFAIYADVGGGIVFLLLLALLGLGLLVWLVYWAIRGFRASFPTDKSWLWWLLRGGPMIALLLCFPPCHHSGDWRDEATGEPIPSSIALEFDRSLFGYIPSFRWVGSVGREQAREWGTVMTILGYGPYRCASFRWAIDWWFLGAEFAVFAILLLPFFRAGQGLGHP